MTEHEALKIIRSLARPKQSVNVHDAVAIICAIWNVADQAVLEAYRTGSKKKVD